MCTHYITLTVNVPIPDWAEWLAQQKNGHWIIYEHKPQRNDVLGFWEADGRIDYIASDEPNPNWQDTLYKIEREK